ncbi:hypothetical protein KJA15_02365 [Patescibacteria group bacterium]|nr:hypothetical protein [Patescibacteria group bacterium]
MEPIEEKIQISVGLPSKKSKVIKIIAGIIILGIVGIGIALYSRAWDPLWNPFRPEPEKVIEEMAIKMGELKTVHSETKIDIEAKEDTKEAFKISMAFGSDSDNTNPKNPKSVGDFNMALAFEGMQFSLVGESKVIGEEFYSKLTTIPALPFLEPFFEILGIDLSGIKNQWIKIDEVQLMRILLGSLYTSEIEEEMQKEKEKQEEMIENLKSLLEGKRLYVVKREFLDKEIKDEKTYHYLVALNEKEVKKIIPELYKILISTIKFGPPPTEEQWKEFQEKLSIELDKSFEKLGEITAEFWIGKKDMLLHKVKGEKEIDLSKFDKTKKGKITIKIDMDFSNFNQPVEVEAPEEYKTLEEIFKIPFFPPPISYSPEFEYFPLESKIPFGFY